MTLDLETLYTATGTAKLADLPAYEAKVKELVSPGADVVLTGRAPIWLYLRIGHLLHGRAKTLGYVSPPQGITEPLEIFNQKRLFQNMVSLGFLQACLNARRPDAVGKACST